ncbi:MAG: metal ABC transporter ATP-binding protein [Candidatus Kapabacteria bacterium]|nr:metal ABC transporter ATP-binding protein [Ignavibacteriota bacterium]MCW5885485.1 metal ABC transporter ATP-binding protein [Candidatus Kapabacteria bacterium]
MEIALKISNLNVIFDKNIILHNINFEVPVGAYVAIVGPNGSGKTTLLKTILGLNSKFNGNINILSNSGSNSGRIAYVPQIKTLDRSFPAIASDLVLSGLNKSWVGRFSKHDKNRAHEILEKLSASDLAFKQLSTLSGGELQRVYLARCLITNPAILLLDEPATGIDLVCEKSVNHIINDYNKNHNTTIMMVTHDWSAAYHHTNFTLLLNKEQIFFGSSSDAFSDSNLQKTFSHLGHDHGIKFGLKENQNA